MMRRPPVWVAELAARFWTAVGDPPPFPRDRTIPLAWLEHIRFILHKLNDPGVISLLKRTVALTRGCGTGCRTSRRGRRS